MPCGKCNGAFTVFSWKNKCDECEENYCSKCLNKINGDVFCETCSVLIKRPPIRTKLMELKSKDLQSYLNKHNISTRGIVEKQELVELFYKNQIPAKDKRKKRFNCNFSGSVPNLAQRSQTVLNNLRTTAETAFNSRNWAPGAGTTNGHGHSAQSTPIRTPQATSPNRLSPGAGPAPGVFNTTTHTTFSATTGGNEPPRVFTSTTTSSGASSASTSNSTYPSCGATSPAANSAFSGTSQPPPAPPPATNDPPESSPQVPRKYPKLSDFQSPDDFNDLSVKQLKELLSLNRVDYKGCVEKAELLERASRLWIDSQIRKEDVSGGDNVGNMDEACKICMDAPLDCVLLECGHMATCIECGKRLAECPICRQYVTRVVRTFKA